MTVNTTQDTPLIEVSSVIQAIQSEANRQLQEAVTGLLQKLISLSVENQTIGMKKYKILSAHQVYYVSFYHFIMVKGQGHDFGRKYSSDFNIYNVSVKRL